MAVINHKQRRVPPQPALSKVCRRLLFWEPGLGKSLKLWSFAEPTLMLLNKQSLGEGDVFAGIGREECRIYRAQGHSAGARDKEETQAAHSRTGTLPIREKRSKETENGD